MSKEDREYYRRLKKMQKHVDRLRELNPAQRQEASLQTVERELGHLREAREIGEPAPR